MTQGDRPASERPALTHQDAAGRVHMVNVGGKDETTRRAIATGTLRMRPETFQALLDNRTPKGDPLRVAEIAGIQAAKRTADLIPLCHPLPLTSARLEVEPDAALPGVRVTATVEVHGRTGVEMEALTAVSVALLTVYDMLKAVDRGMCIESVRLLEKSGGRSGDWREPNEMP
jgi:cyclic pyranopterin monophosphate synthase